MMFMDAISLFMKYLEEVERSPETVKTYKACLLGFNDYMTKRMNRPVYLEDITADSFESYLFEPPNDKKFLPTTRFTIATAFKSFYTFCYKKGYSKTNVGKELIKIKAKSKERTYITEEEMLKMVEQVANETDKAIMQTMFYTGMRITEAINLTFDDINFDGNYIFVRKRKSRYNRKIPISIKLRLILEDYIEDYRSKLDVDTDNVFINEHSGKYTQSHFNTMIKRASNKAGITRNLTSHTMRHSFASNLVAKGADIVKIKKLLGHESIITTNIYLHTNQQFLRRAINML
jgi:site-specific recombinase XerD